MLNNDLENKIKELSHGFNDIIESLRIIISEKEREILILNSQLEENRRMLGLANISFTLPQQPQEVKSVTKRYPVNCSVCNTEFMAASKVAKYCPTHLTIRRSEVASLNRNHRKLKAPIEVAANA